MKKMFLFLTVLLALFTLSACDVWQEFLEAVPTNEPLTEEPLDMQAQMMATRTHIRATNIGVEVELFNQLIGRFELRTGTSRGSGVLFAQRDGYVYALTNFHVIDPQGQRAQYTILPGYHDTAFTGEVVFEDPSKDLAIIRFHPGDVTLPLIDLTTRENKPLQAGEFVLAAGNPSALNALVTFGEFLRMARINDVAFPVILHSALIFPGNSGGALTDLDGHLVGINTWTSRDDDERNLAVPLQEVLAFIRAYDETLIP